MSRQYVWLIESRVCVRQVIRGADGLSFAKKEGAYPPPFVGGYPVINLEAARAVGLTFPLTLLGRAAAREDPQCSLSLTMTPRI